MLSRLVLVIATGIVLAAFEHQWYHADAVRHFTNSLHVWSEFLKGVWRRGYRLTWLSGAILFAACLDMVFSGCLCQTNFDAQ